MLVTGGVSSGKTTFINSISEISSIDGNNTDNHAKRMLQYNSTDSSSTVAIDFGRVTINKNIYIYLFGAPCRKRFRYILDELSNGTLCGVVIVDSNKIEESFDFINFFESKNILFIVVVNCINGMLPYSIEEIRESLNISVDLPLVLCDVREKKYVYSVLKQAIKYIISQQEVNGNLMKLND